MILGIFSVFFMLLCSISSIQLSNKYYQYRYSLRVSMLFFVIISFGLFYFFDYKNMTFKLDKFNFFNDYRFYLGVFFSVLTQQFQIRLFKANENNLSYVKFGDFIFLSLVPIFSFLSLDILNFQDANNINYSFIEMISFSLTLLILSFFLFKNKIKTNSLKKPLLLVYYILSGVMAVVILSKLMQIHNAAAVYISSMLINFFIWIILASKTKEYKKFKIENLKIFFIFALLYLIYSVFNLFAIKYLPVEYITILRTVFAIFIVSFLDLYNNKVFNLTKKDVFILILMFITMFIFS